jgi:hypothetical protein
MFFKVSKRDNLDRYYLIKLFGYGVFLHKIHHDEPNSYHNHPWHGFSIVFGSYNEEFQEAGVSRIVRYFNKINAFKHHRVTLLNGKSVWTLFVHGKRCNKWNVIDKNGNILSEEPWRGIGGRTNYS